MRSCFRVRATKRKHWKCSRIQLKQLHIVSIGSFLKYHSLKLRHLLFFISESSVFSHVDVVYNSQDILYLPVIYLCLFISLFLIFNLAHCNFNFTRLIESSQRGGWIGVCKSADPLKLMAESVGPLKKSTKSESAITDPSRISAILFLVIFSTAWHRYIKKRKWAFQGDVEIHDPNFQTTKIQNPGP